MATHLIDKIKKILENKFVYDSRNYLLAEVLSKSVIFILLPIFTHLLTPDEYGVLSIFNSIVTIFGVIVGVNFHSSLSRKIYSKDIDLPEFIWSNLAFLLVLQAVIVFTILVFGDYLSILLRIDRNIILIAIIVSCLGFYIDLLKAYFQSFQISKSFLILTVLYNILLNLISLIWVLYLSDQRYLGKVYAQVLVTIIIGLYSFYYLTQKSERIFKFKHVKYSLLIGLPLIPHALSSFILNEFDKVMINSISGSYDAGIYSISYSIGMIMMFFVIALNNAWVPVFYNHFNNGSLDKINKLASIYSGFMALIASNLIIFSYEIVLILTDTEYLIASEIVPLIILSYYFVFLYTLYAQYSIFYKKTLTISIFTLICGTLNIILNYLFIPKFGYKVAAVTTLISYILLWLLHYVFSINVSKSRSIRIKYLYKSISLVILCTIFVYSFNYFNFDLIYKFLLSTITIAIFLRKLTKGGFV